MIKRRDKYLLGLLALLTVGSALLTMSAFEKMQASHKYLNIKQRKYRNVADKLKAATKDHRQVVLEANSRDQATSNFLSKINQKGISILDSLGHYNSADQYNQNRTALSKRLGSENANELLPNDDDGTGHSYIDTLKLTSNITDKQVFAGLNDIRNEVIDNVYLIGNIHGGHIGNEKRLNSLGVPVLYSGSYNSSTQDFDKVNPVARLDEKFSSDLDLKN
ncbi:hypothetical protein K1728_06475 [Weissella confusa]|uniref:hypothetical protein n=1 Tax=Weissella confusa TaxID=1583 RepID=UPI001C6F80CA|nr:hypothetical protein [Weissella confusa]QYU56836.1 hypothetical protein K1728_06475 [Weissella confusa]